MPEPASGPIDRSRTWFVPVVLAGLGSSALAAIASAKPWVGSASPGEGTASVNAIEQGTGYPLASAVSLVLLASWGVLLVTRGVVRRAFAVLCVMASLALVGTVVAGYVTLPEVASDTLEAALGRGQDPGFTGWFWTAAVTSVAAVVAGVLAVRLSPRWPEMGARYDAPAGAGATRKEDELDSERDLWRALDEGRDPTNNPTRDP